MSSPPRYNHLICGGGRLKVQTDSAMLCVSRLQWEDSASSPAECGDTSISRLFTSPPHTHKCTHTSLRFAPLQTDSPYVYLVYICVYSLLFVHLMFFIVYYDSTNDCIIFLFILPLLFFCCCNTQMSQMLFYLDIYQSSTIWMYTQQTLPFTSSCP